MGHPRQAPQWSQALQQNAGSQYRSRRRGRTHVCTHTRGRATADAGRGRDNVQGGSQDRHPVGKSRQADVHQDARWSPSVQGDRGSRSARGNPAAALRVGLAVSWRRAGQGQSRWRVMGRAGSGQKVKAGGSAPAAMRRVAGRSSRNSLHQLGSIGRCRGRSGLQGKRGKSGSSAGAAGAWLSQLGLFK
jgi:hypothetical protein